MNKKINEIAKAPLSFGSGAFFVGFEVFGVMSNFIRVIFGMSSPTILRVMRVCVDLGGEICKSSPAKWSIIRVSELFGGEFHHRRDRKAA